MVSGETPLTQHRQDQGAGGWISEETVAEYTHIPTTTTTDKDNLWERINSFKFLVPRRSHHRGSHMVCSHRCSAEEGTSASLLPETAEEVWNEPQNPQILLHLHCGEHPDQLHHSPGLETAPLATAKLCKGSRELPATLLEVSFPPSKTSTPGGVQGKPGGSSRTPATRPTDCSLCCPHGDVSTASDPALADWGIAFSLRLSG